jgi:hypothetical protein
MNVEEITRDLLLKAEMLKPFEIEILDTILKNDLVNPYEMIKWNDFETTAFEHITKYYNVRGMDYNPKWSNIPFFLHKNSKKAVLDSAEMVCQKQYIFKSEEEREEYKKQVDKALNTPLEPLGKIDCDKEAKECYEAFNKQYVKEKPCYFPVPYEELTPSSKAGWRAVYNHVKYGSYALKE